MGLLDAIFPDDDASGLLGFLKRNADLQPMTSGLPSDQADYGSPFSQPGTAPSAPPAMNAMAQAPQAAPPVPQNPPPVIPAQPMAAAPAPPAAAAPSGPNPLSGILNRGADALASIGRGGSMLGAVRGQYDDPISQQHQVANLTASALIQKGVDPQVAIAAVQPGNGEALKALFNQTLLQGAHTQETDKDGNVWDVNRQTGQKTIALAAKDDKFTNVAVKNADGSESVRTLNTKTGEYGPPQGAASQTGALGDMNKTGAEYLATVPQQQRGILQGMVNGTIQPPSSFALAKPYWQTMLAAAKNLDPTFDENMWTSRHKMSSDIAASGNSSMGGILANGKSSFSHLADLSDSMAGLGNASHDFPGGGMLAHGQNYVGNTMGGSDTQAKLKAINDNLGHYGQESTKFYSGTGGGAEERMNALKEMNPAYTSSEEMAAYLGKEKDLMLARLHEKEDDIRKTMGDDYLKQHPVFTPQFQATIDRIDANVAKLNGKAAPAATDNNAAPAVQDGATATNPKTGQRIVLKGGKWVPLQ